MTAGHLKILIVGQLWGRASVENGGSLAHPRSGAGVDVGLDQPTASRFPTDTEFLRDRLANAVSEG